MLNLIHTMPSPHAICIPICTSLQQRRRPWKYFDSQNKLHWCARSFGSLWISSLQFWILILDSLSELCSLLTFSPTHTHTHNVQGRCQAAAATHLQPTWPLPPPHLIPAHTIYEHVSPFVLSAFISFASPFTNHFTLWPTVLALLFPSYYFFLSNKIDN